MNKIFYGLAGEGRGHATRASTIVEALRDECSFTLFTSDQAFDLLGRRYAGTEVQLAEIECPRFRYDRHRRVDKFATGIATLGYIRRLRPMVEAVARRIEKEGPDLCITDFDPVVPRAAELCGVPYVCVDHQHFLVVSDLSGLPFRIRAWSRFMAILVRAYYHRQVTTVVSSFHNPPLRRAWQDRVVQAGVLLRPEIRDAVPERGAHLCVYLRRHASDNLLRALADCGREVRIYGLDRDDRVGNLHFCTIDERRFVEDLATSAALVSTAGNQLVGEALWLGKPVLGMPEPGNEEQHVNGYYIESSGAGRSMAMCSVTAQAVRRFVDEVEADGFPIDRTHLDGTPLTIATLRTFLDRPDSNAPGNRREVRAVKPLARLGT